MSRSFVELNPLIVTLGAVAAGLIAAAGNIHNDIHDLEIDRINRPERPLPRNEISTQTALFSAVFFAFGGIIIGLKLGTFPFIITLTAVLLLYFYNAHLKMTVIWGNIAVSTLTAMAFIFGGVLSGRVEGGIIPAVLSLFFHFSREMIKDMQDYYGDSARRGTTFAREYGIESARKTAAAALFTLFIIVPIPYFAHFYKIDYLIISSIGVEAPLIWTIIKLVGGNNLNLQRISNILKLSMVMGLISLFMGR